MKGDYYKHYISSVLEKTDDEFEAMLSGWRTGRNGAMFNCVLFLIIATCNMFIGESRWFAGVCMGVSAMGLALVAMCHLSIGITVVIRSFKEREGGVS